MEDELDPMIKPKKSLNTAVMKKKPKLYLIQMNGHYKLIGQNAKRELNFTNRKIIRKMNEGEIR